MKTPPVFNTWNKIIAVAATFLITLTGYSQERKLPDGSIIYGDGTRRLPNGTVIYKDGNVATKGTGGGIILPDGSVVYPNGGTPYPNNDKRSGSRKAGWLPPGQAKKIFGGSAKNYAPGQQNKWKAKGNGRKK